MPVLEGNFDIIRPVTSNPLFKEVEPFISTYQVLCKTMIYTNKNRTAGGGTHTCRVLPAQWPPSLSLGTILDSQGRNQHY